MSLKTAKIVGTLQQITKILSNLPYHHSIAISIVTHVTISGHHKLYVFAGAVAASKCTRLPRQDKVREGLSLLICQRASFIAFPCKLPLQNVACMPLCNQDAKNTRILLCDMDASMKIGTLREVRSELKEAGYVIYTWFVSCDM